MSSILMNMSSIVPGVGTPILSSSKAPGTLSNDPQDHSEYESDSECDENIADLMFLLDECEKKSEKKVKKNVNQNVNSSESQPQASSSATHIINETNYREKAPNTVQLQNFDSRDGVWVQFRDGTAFGAYPTIVVPQSMHQYEHVLAILHMKESDREVQVPKFLKNNLVSDHVKMQAIHPVSTNKYWVRPSSLLDGKIVFKKKTWALGRNLEAFVSSNVVKFHFIIVPFHNGVLKYELAESTPEFEVRSKEQQNVTRARQGLINTVQRPRKRRRTAESEARRIALEGIRSDIASKHKEIAENKKIKEENDTRLQHILELTSFSSDPEVMAIHNTVKRHIEMQRKRATSSHNNF